jgi:mycothiol synthase
MTSTILYPSAPQTPGLTFRHLRAPDDYRGMNAIANATRVAEGDDWASSDEQFQWFYEHLSNSDPAMDVLVVEHDGRIVGYGRVGWREELDGQRVYEAISFTDPGRPIEGLLTGIHDTMEARAREVAAAHPPGPKVLESGTAETAHEREALLRSRGYEPVRYGYEMIRPNLDDLLDAPLPDGLEVRKVKPEHLRAIWEADVEAFRDHWGAWLQGEAEYQQFLDDPLQGDTTLWQVAWDRDQVAGMVRAYVNDEENARYGRKRGYVENISVRRPWRRRGLARALIAATFPVLRARGMTEGALGVDTENPSGALRVYESCGFVAVSRSTTWRKRV